MGSSHNGVKTKIIKFACARIIIENSKDWSTRNRDKVSEWSDMSTRGLLVQAKGIPLGRHYLIECTLFSPWYSWNIAQLALNNDHSLMHIQTIYAFNSLVISVGRINIGFEEKLRYVLKASVYRLKAFYTTKIPRRFLVLAKLLLFYHV